MKKYIKSIIICGGLLLLFPFLGFPEIIETIYVIVLGFLVVSLALLSHKKLSDVTDTDGEERSLEGYIQSLQDRFKKHTQEIKQKKGGEEAPKVSRLSDVIRSDIHNE